MVSIDLMWYAPAVIIFFARILDVSVGTVRIVCIAQGRKGLAAMLGFVESLLWLVIISQVMQNLTNWACCVGYASGFAVGNYLGMFLEEKLAMGTVQLRLTTQADVVSLTKELRARGFGVTAYPAEGSTGRATCVSTVLRRRDMQDAVKVVQHHLPQAFYTIEDVKVANAGVFPVQTKPRFRPRLLASRRPV